jgi:hypothetical protein
MDKSSYSKMKNIYRTEVDEFCFTLSSVNPTAVCKLIFVITLTSSAVQKGSRVKKVAEKTTVKSPNGTELLHMIISMMLRYKFRMFYLFSRTYKGLLATIPKHSIF